MLSNNFKEQNSYSTLKVILRIPSKNCIFWYPKLIQLFSIFAQALRSDMLKFGRLSQITNRRYLNAQEIFFWSVKSLEQLIFIFISPPCINAIGAIWQTLSRYLLVWCPPFSYLPKFTKISKISENWIFIENPYLQFFLST